MACLFVSRYLYSAGVNLFNVTKCGCLLDLMSCNLGTLISSKMANSTSKQDVLIRVGLQSFCKTITLSTFVLLLRRGCMGVPIV